MCLKTPFQLGLKTRKKFFKRLKKLRGCQYEKVDKALSEWSQNIPIDGSMVQEKGLFFAKKLEIPDFKELDGWIDKWQKR